MPSVSICHRALEHRPRPTKFISSISAATSISSSCMNDFPKTTEQSNNRTKMDMDQKSIDKVHKYKIPPLECSLELLRNVALNYGRSKCYPNTRLGWKTNASLPSISCKPTWSISTKLIPTWTEGESVSKALSSIKQLASDLTWLDIDICQHLAASGSCSQFWAPMGSQLFQMFSLMQVKTLGLQPAEHLMNVRIWAKLRNAKWLYRLKSTPAKSLRIK